MINGSDEKSMMTVKVTKLSTLTIASVAIILTANRPYVYVWLFLLLLLFCLFCSICIIGYCAVNPES